MSVTRSVMLYGKLADALGARIAVPGGDVGETAGTIRARAAGLDPALEDMLADPRVRACLGDRIIDDAVIVPPGAALDFIPVVSGG